MDFVLKVLVFQHVAHEILGTLNSLLKERKFRVRYINYERDPESRPSIEKYDSLIILGGHMGVYEADKYTHIKIEMQIIEEALKKNIPILGICLGAQILAHVLGANVKKHTQKEIGWSNLHLTPEGHIDRLFNHFKKTEKVFQMHGDTFEIPKSAEHLAYSDICKGQAFRYGEKVYGLQFHLEVDRPMIERWLKSPIHKKDLAETSGILTEEKIITETQDCIDRSIQLSNQTFNNFIDLFGLKPRSILLGSGHGKPTK
ncbi:MAG: hypothetical protein A4S09_03235 [Proteobacteria bacterium SG_bin7]|nr:MAG: hypothetical protein A4S09_03235 [Proteobacteria bacterium SG_bin7]